MAEPIRLAVVGGHRGRSLNVALEAFAERVTLAAICDIDTAVLDQWHAGQPELQTYSSYEALLAESDCDAVYLATPMQLHAAQAVQALDSGRHVLSEVVAACSLEECWQLVEATERSRRVYMLAENYCYMRPNMMVRHMVEQGLFGEPTYAEGAYIHDCCNLRFNADGSLTWRGELTRDWSGNTYPTHSLGPVSQWLGIHRGDRLVSTTTFVTRSAAMAEYVGGKRGADHWGAQPGFWARGDSASTLIRTEKGAVISLRVDSTSPRPHNMTHYALQGTRGAYLSARHGGEDPLVWIAGLSPGTSPPEPGRHPEWESLWKHAERYEHPRWRQSGEQARRAGHGGGDFFILEDFLNAVEGKSPPAIDVYDAVAWSSIVPLSMESVWYDGTPMEIPDFRRGRGGGAR